MSLRIAHFVQRYPPALGGSEAYFARLSRYLASCGERVSVFTTNGNELESFWSPRASTFAASSSFIDDVEIRRYQLAYRFRGRRWLLKPLSLLPQRDWQCLTQTCNPIAPDMWRDAGCVAQRFDVVHATAFPYAFPILCARRLARRLNVPFFLTPFLHLGDPLAPGNKMRRVYTAPPLMSLAKTADVIFAQTPTERLALIEGGVSSERIVLQGLGVDASECTGGDGHRARQSWSVASDDVVIGHLSNNSEEKGTVDLLKAAELLWREGMLFRLVLAGPQMPSFRRFWGTYGNQRKVECLGPLSDAQKRDFFAGLDLFALPSKSDSFGLVLLEAWANGLPSVAYRAGGIADVVRHGMDGFLATCGDVQALAGALRCLITDSAFRQRLGTCGCQRLPREFRWPDKLELVRQACYVRSATPGHPVESPGNRAIVQSSR